MIPGIFAHSGGGRPAVQSRRGTIAGTGSHSDGSVFPIRKPPILQRLDSLMKFDFGLLAPWSGSEHVRAKLTTLQRSVN
jgi:hypothetical protein